MERVEQARTTSAQEPGASTLRQSVSLSGPAADKSSSGESVDSIESLSISPQFFHHPNRFTIYPQGPASTEAAVSAPGPIPYRAGMERAFAADLSGVRAYCGASALLADSGVPRRRLAGNDRLRVCQPCSTCGGT